MEGELYSWLKFRSKDTIFNASVDRENLLLKRIRDWEYKQKPNLDPFYLKRKKQRVFKEELKELFDIGIYQAYGKFPISPAPKREAGILGD